MYDTISHQKVVNNQLLNKENKMKELIKIVENEPRVSHRVIAENTNNNQKNVNEIIRKYEDDFKQFGILPFETEKLKMVQVGVKKPHYSKPFKSLIASTFLINSSLSVFDNSS